MYELTMEATASQAAYMMVQTDRLQKTVMENLCNPLGIGRTLPVILGYLKNRGTDYPTQADIAEYFDVSPAAITVTLKKMEKAGLVNRIAQKNNARANEVILTEKGTGMAAEILDIYDGLNLDMLEGITEEEMETFLNTLSKMQHNLREKYAQKVTRREK